jgi:lipocalin
MTSNEKWAMVGRTPASYTREASITMAKQSEKKQAKLSLKEKRELKRAKSEEGSVRIRKGM